MLRTRENSDVFNRLDEIYLVFTRLKKVNILYVFSQPCSLSLRMYPELGVICLYLEIITYPPSRYQAYRPGSSIFARGPLGLRANMEYRADMPGNAMVDMF